jgi:6-phosphofructokinase 1
MSKKNIQRIGIVTSGSDAPGMNAALRAAVRHATFKGLEVFGIHRGYEGLIDGLIEPMGPADVSNIIHRGGTILKTAASERFRSPEGRQAAFEHLQARQIDGLIALGGNGTLAGADIFAAEHGLPIIGIPATIDNDLFGTDLSIGFDTAVNTAIDAVDKIRDTADSHNRLFFVEVMGRFSGFIAMYTGIGTGAGSIIIPEAATPVEALIETLKTGGGRKKLFSVIIVAEGSPNGSAQEIAQRVKDALEYIDAKVTVIGHLQRGGSPTALDRVLAARLGFASVEQLLAGKTGMVGIVNGKIRCTPFVKAISQKKKVDQDLLRMAEILAL